MEQSVSSVEFRILQTGAPHASPELPALLPQLTDMINQSYSQQDKSYYGGEDIFPGQRLRMEGQLAAELGPGAILALAFDSHEVVALACIKPWEGAVIDLLHAPAAASATGHGPSNISQPPNSRDWEVMACATKNDPRYRGQGLVVKCVDSLVQHLQATPPKPANQDARAGPLCLWVTVLEGVGNAEYWQRRGFVRCGGPDPVPAGTWGSTRPFEIGTLNKVVG